MFIKFWCRNYTFFFFFFFADKKTEVENDVRNCLFWSIMCPPAPKQCQAHNHHQILLNEYMKKFMVTSLGKRRTGTWHTFKCEAVKYVPSVFIWVAHHNWTFTFILCPPLWFRVLQFLKRVMGNSIISSVISYPFLALYLHLSRGP